MNTIAKKAFPGPRIRTVLDACNKKDPRYACSWSGVSARTEDSPPVIVGPDDGTKQFLNCGADGFLRETINWSHTKDSTWTVGVPEWTTPDQKPRV